MTSVRTNADKKLNFDNALAFREAGKYKEAADLFLDLARDTDDLFEKVGMLLDATHALKGSGRVDLAKNQLDLVRELLSLPSGTPLSSADDENRRRLVIGAELEAARISAEEKKLPEAMAKLDSILTDHQSELRNPGFVDIYWAIQRDRGFRLTDLGSFEEALRILEQVDSADPRDRWTLFYLGYCYHCTDKYAEANEKLEEALLLHLLPDFEGQAHCLLGVGHYKLGNYRKAKLEFEEGVKTAPTGYIKQAGIWRWLECTCAGLGLTAEAEHYGRLARTS
jgi:tetratricopeptide (TPR) repeat protein